MHLARVAELMDAPEFCLLDGLAPDAPLLHAALRRGIVLMIPESGREETAACSAPVCSKSRLKKRFSRS